MERFGTKNKRGLSEKTTSAGKKLSTTATQVTGRKLPAVAITRRNTTKTYTKR